MTDNEKAIESYKSYDYEEEEEEKDLENEIDAFMEDYYETR